MTRWVLCVLASVQRFGEHPLFARLGIYPPPNSSF